MILIDRKLVKKEIKECTVDDLHAWRRHAVKCLDYFLKYRDDFEIEECEFIIDHIDQRLNEINNETNI